MWHRLPGDESLRWLGFHRLEAGAALGDSFTEFNLIPGVDCRSSMSRAFSPLGFAVHLT
jgi:hypothetical protein